MRKTVLALTVALAPALAGCGQGCFGRIATSSRPIAPDRRKRIQVSKRPRSFRRASRKYLRDRGNFSKVALDPFI